MSRYTNPLNIKWFATVSKGIEELAKNTDFQLTTSDFRLLFYILAKINVDNRAVLPKQPEISQEINLSIRKISESLSKLQSAYIIVKTEETRTYFINPAFFYAGGHQTLEAKQADFDSHFNPKPETYTPKTTPQQPAEDLFPPFSPISPFE